VVAPLNLNTRTWGVGERRVLLLHGLSSSSAGWWRVGPDLAARGFHVVAPDLRGHGRTGQAERLDDSIAGYVSDVLGLGGGWTAMLGHSLGGRLALECQIADPGFAQVLVLEDPALHIPNDPAIVAELSSEYETELSEEAFRLRYPRWAPQDVAGKVEALRQSSRRVVELTLEAIMDGDHWGELAKIDVATLVMGSRPDDGGLVSHAVGERAAEQANVEYAGIDGSGHSIHRDSYDAFWRVLMDFLARCGIARGGV